MRATDPIPQTNNMLPTADLQATGREVSILRKFSAHSDARAGRAAFPAPWWLWWNILSIHAPTVAVVWALLFAHATHAKLRSVELIVLSRSAGSRAWAKQLVRETKGAIGRIWTSGVTRALYAAFRATTGLRVRHLRDYASAIVRAGFQLRHEQNALGGLLHTSIWRCPSCAASQ